MKINFDKVLGKEDEILVLTIFLLFRNYASFTTVYQPNLTF